MRSHINRMKTGLWGLCVEKKKYWNQFGSEMYVDAYLHLNDSVSRDYILYLDSESKQFFPNLFEDHKVIKNQNFHLTSFNFCKYFFYV